MAGTPDTVWHVIDGARRGDAQARSLFARRYDPVVRAYLGARWRGTPLLADVDDAAQEVFVDLLKGALGRADPARRFRPFLFGVARNVALRVEARRARRRAERLPSEPEAAPVDGAETASRVFERAWAEALLAEARALMARRAFEAGSAAERRVELLELRFGDGLPVREIAARFGEDPDRVHRQYAQARLEFHRALREVVGRYQEGPEDEVDAECRRLLDCFR